MILLVLFTTFLVVTNSISAQNQVVNAALQKVDNFHLIKVLSPAYCSDVKGKTVISFRASGSTSAIVKCWKQDAVWGHDSIFPAVTLDKEGNGKFIFETNRFPHGPTCIRISTANDQCYLQLYNQGGASWHEGIPAVPVQAKGMSLAFEDDFSGPLSISSSGVGHTYSSRHIDGNFSAIPFADYESSQNPFLQKDTYLRIRADVNKGSAGLISSRRSDSTYSCAVKFGYFECRFIAPMVKGSWPAFWGCTARGKAPENKYCDEIDIIEAYGNAPDRYETCWHKWEKKHTAPKAEFIPITTIGGKSSWSTTSHLYGVLIKQDSTTYYCDNIQVWKHATTSYCKTTPLYFMINLALSEGGKPYDLTRYNNAADMYVDYVRVFKQ